MMNPIRNIERMPGAGGPERSLVKSAEHGLSLDPARKKPHNYPMRRAPRGVGAGVFGQPGVFQEGGQVDERAPDSADLREPDDQLSPHDAQMKQVVVEAMMALRGESPEPEKAIQRFIDTFGEAEYRELRQMVLGHPAGSDEHAEPDADDQGGPPDQDEDNAPQPGDSGTQPPSVVQPTSGMQVGGLLQGPGSGQDDQIEARTPAGRKVLLSDGEYVVDAPTVAALGDGSTSSGARRLDTLRKAIRKQAYGHGEQAKPMRKGGRALLDILNS
jgi:hypothetical protein